MIWKYLKIGIPGLCVVALLVTAFLYLNAFDWSNKHSARVAALDLYHKTVTTGEYRLRANDLEFLIRVAGMQNDGPGIILLHGFPESSLMWEALLEQGAAAGYKVMAFDQRGYSPKARPNQVEAYEIDYLVQDVIAVADEIGFDTFHLVGHDWGAAVGWTTVMGFPERIHTWTAMSIPHTAVFFDAVLNNPEQQKRSAYIKRFQLPFLPEFLFYLNQKKVADALSGRWTDQQIEECLAIQREYGATRAAFNWYRASDIGSTRTNHTLGKNILRPTLFIWGTEDPVVDPNIIPLQQTFIKAPYVEMKVQSGHSIMQTQPDIVIEAILKHLNKATSLD